MASPRRAQTRPANSSDMQVRLPPIKSLHLAHTAPEPDRDSVYPTPLSAWPNQQFSRTTPLVPTTVDPAAAAAATTTNLSYPTPISARPHLPHRTSSNSTHPSAYTPHTPTGHPALHTFQPSSFHYVPPTTAESTTSTTSSGRNPGFVDDTRTTAFGHDRTGPAAGFTHEGRTAAASTFTQEGRPAFGHERTASGSGYPNTSERQRYPTHQNQNHDVRYSHDPRYPPSQSQETRYQSQDTRYPATQSQDPRYTHPPSDPRYVQSQSQPQSQNPDPRYPSTQTQTQAQTPSQPRDPSQQQQPDDRSVYTPAEARAGGYAPVQSSPEIRSVYPPDGRTTYAHTQDTRGGYTSDPRYASSQDPRYAPDMRYPQEARGAYAADVTVRNTYTQPQDPRYPPDARNYTAAPDARGYPSSQTNPELDGRGYVAPTQDARSIYPAQDTRTTSAYSATPVQDPRSTFAPPTQTQGQTQDSRGYAPPPQHPLPQLQAQPQPQEPRYATTSQEPRNTFPTSSHPQSQAYVTPTQTQPPTQDGRGYAPTVPSEQRNYAHTDVHVRGYPHSERGGGAGPQQQLHQQVSYSHAPPDTQTQTGRNPSVVDSQPQTQTREQQVQPQGQTRATERSGGFDPRAVEVRPGVLQRQPVTVLETRPGVLEARVGPAVLESHGRSLEGPGRPTGLAAQSQGTQRGAERIGKDDIVREIVQHCTTLYKFANHYAHIQLSNPLLQPSSEEVTEMMARAGEVVRLLEALRNDTPIFASTLFSTSASNTLVPAHSLDTANAMGAVKGVGLGMAIMDVDAPDRAPKRPWEDMDGILVPGSTGAGPAGTSAPQSSTQGNTDQDRSTAEADMEHIRTKRAITTMAAAAASGTGGGGTAGGKNKYRKRSRATPPGKCHSCNIRETPEWRRGPDGARTLCNACGLHYAKLVRKRDKAVANGETPSIQHINMEMLRASARAAEGEKLARAALGGVSTGGGVTMTAGNTGNADGGDEKMNLGIHQGSFQINADAGEPMQAQETTPQASASYSRPPTSRPVTSKRPSSSRVMQSPGMPNQHQSASSSSHHSTVPHHSSTPGPHLSTPSISHHQTPTMTTTPSTHQTNTSASASRHPAQPVAQPASQQNKTHPTGAGHHQPTSAQAHHPPQVQHPPPSLHRPGPPPTPPWYLSPHPQPHSMLRQ